LQREEEDVRVVTVAEFLEETNEEILDDSNLQNFQKLLLPLLLNCLRDCVEGCPMRVTLDEFAMATLAFQEALDAAGHAAAAEARVHDQLFASDEDEEVENVVSIMTCTCSSSSCIHFHLQELRKQVALLTAQIAGRDASREKKKEKKKKAAAEAGASPEGRPVRHCKKCHKAWNRGTGTPATHHPFMHDYVFVLSSLHHTRQSTVPGE
jgi:hypothetical protein